MSQKKIIELDANAKSSSDCSFRIQRSTFIVLERYDMTQTCLLKDCWLVGSRL